MTQLQQAIRRLYEVFAIYPKPAVIHSCPCGCTKPEETAPLLAASLTELPGRVLTNYAFSAMTTQGNLNDFRYFLPRLFEAIVEDMDGINAEILFGKLSCKKANWKDWPEPEVEAVKGYLLALWRTALSCCPIHECIPTFFEIETALACIATTGESLEAYLQIWTDTRTVAADGNLVQFVDWHGSEFHGGKAPHRAFWSGAVLQGRELRGWLLRVDTMKRIANSAHLLREDGDERQFQSALSMLANETASP